MGEQSNKNEKKEVSKRLASNLDILMKRNHCTQTDIANVLKSKGGAIQQATVSKWIKSPESNIIPLWVLPTLADLFQISVEDFVCRNYKEENGSNEESTDRITREMSDSVFKGYDGK